MKSNSRNRNYEIKVQSWENSESYDPRFSRNGGGYAQPTILGTITWKGCRKPIKFMVDDTSCGDFGDRYEIAFTDGPSEMCGRYTTNGVDFNGEIPDESTFRTNRALLAIREEFRRVVGWDFLTQEEVEDRFGNE